MARKLKVEIVGDASSLQRAFGRASRSSSGFARGIGTLATAVRRLALPVAAGGIAALKMSADFDKSMSKIVGLVGISQKQVDAWKKDVLDMSKTLPESPKKLADALYFVTSAGLRGKTAMDALRSSARASAAGLGDMTTVADAVTSAMNAYGADTLSAAKATDVLVATVREGKVAPDELAGTLGRILPLASNLGVSFNQVGAAMASMTRVGLDANTAATGLRAIFSQLSKVTPQTAKELATVGLSAEGLRKELREKGLLALMETLQKRFHGNLAQMSKVFPNIRALTGYMAQMGKQTDATAGIFKRMNDVTGATDHAFQAASQTLSFKFNTALSTAEALMVNMGEKLKPVAKLVLGFATGLFDQLDRLISGSGSFSSRLHTALFGGLVTTGPAMHEMGAHRTATRYVEGVVGQMQDAFHRVNWAGVGTALVSGIATAVGKSAQLAGAISKSVMESLAQIDWEKVGSVLGPGLAAAVLAATATLLNPSFWAGHWKEILSVMVLAVPVDAVAAKLGIPFVRMFSRPLAAVTKFVARWAGRFGLEMLRGIGEVLPEASGALARLVTILREAFAKLPTLASESLLAIGRAFGNRLGFAIREAGAAMGRLAGVILNPVRRLFGPTVKAALEIGRGLVRGILSGIADIGRMLYDALKSKIAGAISAVKGFFHIHSPSLVTMKQIGEPLAMGVVQGFKNKAALLNATVLDVIKKATEQGKTALAAMLKELLASAGRNPFPTLQTSPHGVGGQRVLPASSYAGLSNATVVTHPYKVRTGLIPTAGKVLGMAGGGTGRALGPTLFYSGGNEDYAFSGEGRSFRRGGSPVVNVTVNGWVGSDQQIADRIRDELVKAGRRDPNIFGGYA